MIFVSVGTQLSFPRMMKVVESWAEKNKESIVFAQTADATPLKCVKVVDFLSAKEFQARFVEADVIISHAGMGNILTALEMDKNIVIFSRKAELNEHRNDHQVSTAKKFSNHPSVYVVEDLDSLAVSLSDIKAMKVGSGTRFKSDASIKLNKFLVGSVNDWF